MDTVGGTDTAVTLADLVYERLRAGVYTPEQVERQARWLDSRRDDAGSGWWAALAHWREERT